MCISIHLIKQFTKIIFHTYQQMMLVETNGVIPSESNFLVVVWSCFFFFFSGGKKAAFRA